LAEKNSTKVNFSVSFFIGRFFLFIEALGVNAISLRTKTLLKRVLFKNGSD
jgi:hypothetical protein